VRIFSDVKKTYRTKTKTGTSVFVPEAPRDQNLRRCIAYLIPHSLRNIWPKAPGKSSYFRWFAVIVYHAK